MSRTIAVNRAPLTAAGLGTSSVGSDELATDAVITAKIDDDAVTTAKIIDDAVTAAKIPFFLSAEQTGTGAEQDIAHGLVTLPGIILVIPSEIIEGASDILEGAHDVTNVKVTATTGLKYKVFAIK